MSVIYKTDEETVYAVNDLDLTLSKGETLGLVGETGAGKTTTALSVMRLLPDRTGIITHGQIRLGDLDITKATEADMRLVRGNGISMVFQDPMTSLNPILTVGEQIVEVLQLHRHDMSPAETEKKVDEILELVGLLPTGSMNIPISFPAG